MVRPTRVTNSIRSLRFASGEMTQAELADRVGVMRDGRLVQAGTPAELLREPADAYVGELLDAPRRQARLVEALLGGAG